MKLLVLMLMILRGELASSQPSGGWSLEVLNYFQSEGYTAFEKFESSSSASANFALRNRLTCPGMTQQVPSRPSSVHRLRPSDIEVIGAIGDSLTAANGAKANTIIGVLLEDRGVSWSIGGENSDITRLVTLPNILRQFNPNIYGFSAATSGVGSNLAGFNLGYPGDTSFQTLSQAKLLVERIKSSTRVDFYNSWKLITFFIGGNDLCRSCSNSKFSAANYLKNVKDTLDYLQDNLPRAFINMVLTLDVSGIDLLDGVICRKLHNCGLSQEFRSQLKEITQGMQKGVEDLVGSGRYDLNDNFTVVVQPFMKYSSPPKRIDGSVDFSYFAPDCFHFSAKGHAAAAVELWKNMITPVGVKADKWTNLNLPIPCPTNSYLFTRKNS